MRVDRVVWICGVVLFVAVAAVNGNLPYAVMGVIAGWVVSRLGWGR